MSKAARYVAPVVLRNAAERQLVAGQRRAISLCGVYAIIDANLIRPQPPERVAAALSAAGVTWIQYRHKHAAQMTVRRNALRIRAAAPRVVLLINDYVALAAEPWLDGVHIGQDDMPCRRARRVLGAEKIIGVTVRTPAQARRAAAQQADYLGVGPVFSTQTKEIDCAPLGLDGLERICAQARIPVAAIGGINQANAVAVLQAGAAAICAVSALLTAADVGAAARRLIATVDAWPGLPG